MLPGSEDNNQNQPTSPVVDDNNHDHQDTPTPKEPVETDQAKINMEEETFFKEQPADEQPFREIQDKIDVQDYSIRRPKHNRAAAILTTATVIVLALSFGGGYFLSKNWSNLRGGLSSSADEDESPTFNFSSEENKDTLKDTASTDTLKSNQTIWPTYTNTKYFYSIKYPDTWYSQGTNNAQSASVQFLSEKPSTEGQGNLTGFKVEVVAQETGGKTLKEWIIASNTLGGVTADELTPIKIDTADGLQQTVSTPTKAINTYLLVGDKVIIISYYASQDQFLSGQTYYSQILSNFKLTS